MGFPGFQDLMYSSPVNAILSIFGGIKAQKDWREAQEANLRQYGQGEEALGGLQSRVMGSNPPGTMGAPGSGGTPGTARWEFGDTGIPVPGMPPVTYQHMDDPGLVAGSQPGAGGGGGGYESIPDLSTRLQAGYAALTDMSPGMWAALMDPIEQAYAQRTATGMGMLSGLGAQASADIETRWANLQSSMRQEATSRGLGTTSLPMAIGRETRIGADEELARLNEMLRRERLGIYAGLSGEQLAAAGMIHQGAYGAMTEPAYRELTAGERLGQMPAQYDIGLTGMQTDWLQTLNFQPPSSNIALDLSQQFSPLNNPDLYKPEEPTGWDRFMDVNSAMMAGWSNLSGSKTDGGGGGGMNMSDAQGFMNMFKGNKGTSIGSMGGGAGA